MSNALDIAHACVPSAESELPIMPHARAILVGVARDRIQAALNEARRKAIEECAAIAETHIHGWEQDEYTAPAAHAVRKLASSEIAQAICALLSESKT